MWIGISKCKLKIKLTFSLIVMIFVWILLKKKFQYDSTGVSKSLLIWTFVLSFLFALFDLFLMFCSCMFVSFRSVTSSTVSPKMFLNISQWKCLSKSLFCFVIVKVSELYTDVSRQQLEVEQIVHCKKKPVTLFYSCLYHYQLWKWHPGTEIFLLKL